MKAKLKYGLMLAGALAILAGDIAGAAADGVLTIGRREDGTNHGPGQVGAERRFLGLFQHV